MDYAYLVPLVALTAVLAVLVGGLVRADRDADHPQDRSAIRNDPSATDRLGRPGR